MSMSGATDELARRRDEATVNRELWMRHLQANARGEGYKGNVFNVMKALELAPDLAGIVTFDEFSRKLTVAKPPPWDQDAKARLWTDADDVQLQRWLQQMGVPVQGSKTVSDAVLASAPRRDSLRAYLEALKWDKTKRADAWLAKYLGVEQNDYAQEVGKRWLVSAVARALKPGCQADHTLSLEGPQGIGKSSAVRIMGGQWAKESLPSLDTKDAVVELQGAWIVELSELAAMTRAETEAVKAFLTRTVDKYREPYGRHPIEQPRRSVFVATTNEERYLKDTSGNRRFWPVRVTKINFAALTRDRDQLWAEAVQMFRNGMKWHLTDETVIRRAELEQSLRVEDDPWTPLLRAHLEAGKPVTTHQLLAAVGVDEQHRTGGHAKRVGGIMRRQGWVRNVDRSGGTRDVIWVPGDQRTPTATTKKARRSHGK
jgi:predicted P-loop ATPase